MIVSTVGEVHSAGHVNLIDQVEVDGFRATSAARTIVDLASEVPMRELENAIDSSLRLGWTSEPFLRRRLADLRHRGRAGVRLLDRALDGAGGHSRLEREFLALVRRGRTPEAGVPAHPSPGRTASSLGPTSPGRCSG